MSADAPMRLRLSWDAAQWQWLWRFYRACNRKANRAGSAQLWRLAQESRVLLEGLREEGLGVLPGGATASWCCTAARRRWSMRVKAWRR
ncbi:hypothetical protein JOS77_29635 [Chromobacterium haemolyticum]|nr:hypothetical protein JOS77_29635 [Chromobacterium haemolyticum]